MEITEQHVKMIINLNLVMDNFLILDEPLDKKSSNDSELIIGI